MIQRAGIIALVISLLAYIVFKYVLRQADQTLPDLGVYRQAGNVVARVRPYYDSTLASPLYDWPLSDLPFTYPPFAAVIFAALSLFSLQALSYLSVAVSLAALVVTSWAAFGGLGYRGRRQLGLGLLVAAIMLWTEPVLQTMSLGQVELVLLALIMCDMCQPDQRRWKGVGVGIAAGIKLVPLIFIPYLLLTRRFRAAGVALGTFVATFVIGFVALPEDSWTYWLNGLFAHSGRAGIPESVQDQSLNALITRLSGSIAAGAPVWLAVAVIVGILGLGMAAILSRGGHEVAGVLATGVTGVLISPVSWDHHWVWIVPAVAVLADYAIRHEGTVRKACLAAAALVFVLFAGWPRGMLRHLALLLWGQPPAGGGYFGLIYATPNSDTDAAMNVYLLHGDQGSFAEYHWQGLQLILGNLYVLSGLALFAGLAVAAWVVHRYQPQRHHGSLGTGPRA
jgi:alpha-1,2-mannosyltransferase